MACRRSARAGSTTGWDLSVASNGVVRLVIERLLIAAFVAVLGWSVWSYFHSGIVFAVIAAARQDGDSLDLVRDAIARAGPFGPAAYVAAVVLEVLVAPIPGTLLYAPGGAIFGGGWGGTLSLAGNVIGAATATWLASAFGHRLVRSTERQRASGLAEKLRRHGLFVIVLLRVNPLTSSDLVSYAAGLVGIPVWRVAVGTLIGMAPLCYAQSYASEWIFRVMPSSGVVVLALGAAYLVVVLWIVARMPRRES
jgi:uncharacterized membrane protein YdjX (TVP38/TMEM64 family)